MHCSSSFLLQHAHTVHCDAIDVAIERRSDDLRTTDFGASEADVEPVPLVLELVAGVRRAYKRFAPTSGSAQPMDTLITEVVLGMFGCLPTADAIKLLRKESEQTNAILHVTC